MTNQTSGTCNYPGSARMIGLLETTQPQHKDLVSGCFISILSEVERIAIIELCPL